VAVADLHQAPRPDAGLGTQALFGDDVRVFDVAEAAGVAAIVAMGLAAMASGSAFLTNVLPHGRLTELLSGGTVPLLNIATGTAVASALVVLLAKFLEQALVLDSGPGRR
jgi:multicomponent Na+:H+ antiporter subunit B